MELPDLVVPVREDRQPAAQVRPAFREANLPHRRVWIIGYRPPRLGGVGFIPTQRAGRTKYANTTLAIGTLQEHTPRTTCSFMEPLESMPVLHRGRSVRWRSTTARASGSYLRGMRETRDLLVQYGHEDPLSYELTVPLLVDKAGMLHALETGGLDVLHKRTAHGILAQVWRGADRRREGPAPRPRFDRSTPFLSTMPESTALFGLNGSEADRGLWPHVGAGPGKSLPVELCELLAEPEVRQVVERHERDLPELPGRSCVYSMELSELTPDSWSP